VVQVRPSNKLCLFVAKGKQQQQQHPQPFASVALMDAISSFIQADQKSTNKMVTDPIFSIYVNCLNDLCLVLNKVRKLWRILTKSFLARFPLPPINHPLWQPSLASARNVLDNIMVNTPTTTPATAANKKRPS